MKQTYIQITAQIASLQRRAIETKRREIEKDLKKVQALIALSFPDSEDVFCAGNTAVVQAVSVSIARSPESTGWAAASSLPPWLHVVHSRPEEAAGARAQ